VSKIEVKEPVIIKNVLSNEDHRELKLIMQNWPLGVEYYQNLGRYHIQDKIIDEYAEKLIPLARKIFNSETLKPSYSLFSNYQTVGANIPNLHRHKDFNANTYTIDLCLYQTEPWALGVSHNGEDKEYILQENEALFYYGNDQDHWRPEFPNPDSQSVALIFFHYVEPDHWYYVKGPDYQDVIKGDLTEDEWNSGKRLN
jgi:hypothetical protein